MHHSDRGVQYASGDYTGLLKEHGITISMSRSGKSFMKTLKYEEVYRQEYRDREEALAFIERVYNQKRLHSALGYRPPVEFERALAAASQTRAKAGA